MINKKSLSKVGLFLDSRWFLGLILLIFILQSLWVAWSFLYPMIYDEQYHFSIIEIYARQFSPFIFNQPVEYDYLRDLGNETSYLFHYLMSYPYRILNIFTDTQNHLVFTLRCLNILLTVIGLLGFYKLFRQVGIPKRYINVGLLLFATLPIVSLTAATINYDNMLFAVVPFFLISAVRIVSEKKINIMNLLLLITLGLLASLIKYTFLPLFAVVAAFILIYLLRVHKKKIFRDLFQSLKETKKKSPAFLVLVILAVIFLGLFSAVYLKNVVVYRTPSPSCQKTMEVDRCLSSSIVKRNLDALATKDQRVAQELPDYSMSWITSMWRLSMMSGAANSSGISVNFSPALYYSAVFYSVIIISAGVMYGIGRGIFSSKAHILLLVSLLAVVGAVYLFNVNGYYKANIAFANQPRYLLTAMPIFIVFGVYSLAVMLRRFVYIKYAVLVIAVLLLTLGGGALTHVLASNSSWYRQNDTVQSVNAKLKKAAHLIVIENVRR